MDASLTAILLTLSVLLNIVVLGLFFRQKNARTNKEAQAINRLVKQFERDRAILLHIEAVNPDNVYLRHPGGLRG